jgi:hypothetical protein
LLFPLDDGIEVLYREGNFGLNYVRGLAIIFCWMALLAALGLAAASFLSFPVAAFVALSVMILVLSSGTLSNAVSEGTIANYNAEKGTKGFTPADVIVIPVFKAVLTIINLARDFSPIDSLSTAEVLPGLNWAGQQRRSFCYSAAVWRCLEFRSLPGVNLPPRKEHNEASLKKALMLIVAVCFWRGLSRATVLES